LRKVTALEVDKIAKPGLHCVDQPGLYLQVKGPQRSWVYRYQIGGKPRWAGLGSARDVGLADARKRRDTLRAQVLAGVDPVAEKHKQRAPAGRTFRDYAQDYIRQHEASWRSTTHRKQWESSLASFVNPVLGELPVNEIGTEQVRQVLEPIWHLRTTAMRVRGRLEAVLAFAASLTDSDRPNPASWQGHLKNIFWGAKGITKGAVKHHAALPFAELPGFMAALRQREGIGARALEFLVLTAGRTGEVLGARWSEIKGDAWTIPGSRMKAGKPHRVPLSSAAVAVIEQMRAVTMSDYVFPGQHGRPLDKSTLAAVLSRMGVNVTPHGFRSSFRDWASETTEFSPHVVEMALAHSIGSKVEAAYRRGDLFTKRTLLMQAWSDYCEGR
jgi:integrase